ncbi:hypothetical protein KFL_005320030 [Klebsormidium nitens]|uniref:Uncharacterized protein n=1 Tax=Klebsormidium nitens TaxID=105231 RepID=A0A1Y1IK49_KLENI|nr:hypothetical protein KFL_005320030 [Klebsormidium nitens]|eukprot:GAQ89521.1 hypothetical protein KFL_005320030 [Klebsormidium nitens]
MGRTPSERPTSGAGKRTADDKSAARWFDWQGPSSSQNGRPRTADVSRNRGGSVRLTVMQAAAAQAAAEAQANAVRNGLPHKGATSPKSGLHPALLSNDQNNYKRRHGLDLQTTKVSRQWSHSGHFPGMTLSCWARGCSKLWGCDHGVGDEELDRQLDLPEWEGRGNDPSVPEWLRYEGKIVNRKLSKRFVLGFCHHVWDYKYPPPLIIEINGVPTPVKREPRHGGLSLAFHECMKTTYGPPKLVAGVAYNMYYGLLRFGKEHADVDIFCRILTDELPSPALFAYMEELEALRGLLRAADTDSRNKLPRGQVIQVLKERFGDAFDEARERAARAALDAEQPPLSVHPSWYLDPQNSRKAARISDVEYEKLISETRDVDHGPFAQLAKTLIIEELRAREWPAARGDITRRPKYGDFLAWRKAKVGATAAGVVGYLSRAVQTPRGTAARETADDRGTAPEGPESRTGGDESSASVQTSVEPKGAVALGARGSGQNLAPIDERLVVGSNRNPNSQQEATPIARQDFLAGVNENRNLRQDPAPYERVTSGSTEQSRGSDQDAAPRKGHSKVGATESRQAANPPQRMTDADTAAKDRSARGFAPGAQQSAESVRLFGLKAVNESGENSDTWATKDRKANAAESIRPSGREVGLKAADESVEIPGTRLNGGRKEHDSERGTAYDDKGVVVTGSRSVERPEVPRAQYHSAESLSSASEDIPEQLWKDDPAVDISKKSFVERSVMKATKEEPVFAHGNDSKIVEPRVAYKAQS